MHSGATQWAPTAAALASPQHLARDPQLLQLHMLAQLTQVIHIEDLLPELEAAGRGQGLGRGVHLLSRPPQSPRQRTTADRGLTPHALCLDARPPQVSASELNGEPGETTAPPLACAPNDGLEEDEQGLDEHGGVHDVQGLDVLLVPVGRVGAQERPRASWVLLTHFLTC